VPNLVTCLIDCHGVSIPVPLAARFEARPPDNTVPNLVTCLIDCHGVSMPVPLAGRFEARPPDAGP
jgi:hypothetical protein